MEKLRFLIGLQEYVQLNRGKIKNEKMEDIELVLSDFDETKNTILEFIQEWLLQNKDGDCVEELTDDDIIYIMHTAYQNFMRDKKIPNPKRINPLVGKVSRSFKCHHHTVV